LPVWELEILMRAHPFAVLPRASSLSQKKG
jgi:hypothetical protein